MQHLDLFDSERQRAVPVTLYPTQSNPESAPWLLFSVGFGGGRDGYGFLGRSWSEAGFNVAVIEHVGSNLKVLQSIQRPGMRQAELAQAVGERVRDPKELADRPLDLNFVRSHLCPRGWVGLAGHSFGSYTCLAALGATGLTPAYEWAGSVLMSVQPPESMVPRSGFSQLNLPILMLTGTRDSGMPAGIEYQQRLEAYHALPAGQKHLGVLEGADHMAFAGIGLNVDPFVRTLIQITVPFWTQLRDAQPFQWPDALPVGVHYENA